MKLRHKIFMVFLISFSSFYCTEERNKKIIEVTFEDIGKYELKTFDYLTFKPHFLIKDSLELTHYLDIQQPLITQLITDDNQYMVFLEPGYELKITIENEEIIFKGEDATFNNQWLKLEQLKKKYSSVVPFFQLNYGDYISRIDSLKSDFHRLLEEIKGEKNRMLLNDFYTAFILSQNLNFALVHYDLYDKKTLIPQNLKTSFEKLPSYDHLLDLGNSDYIIALHLYQDAILGPQIWREEFKDNDSLQNKYNCLLYEQISKLQFKPNLKEFFHAKALFTELLSKGLSNDFFQLIDKFQKQYPNSIYIKIIEDYKQELEKMQEALFPKIGLIDLNGQEVNMKSFRGKLIYLDIWATWCKPCIQEFPYSILLQQKFQNENILFVYLSVDSDKSKWKSYLEVNKDIKGIHLIEKEAGSVFNSLNLDGIPRYMIIDKQGSIIDAHAPRPSNEKALKILKELI